MRNNAHVHALTALQAGVQEIPSTITGLDFDNGTEFLNKAVITWAGERDIYFTRSPLQEERPGHDRVQEQPPRPQVTASTTATTPARNATP